MFDEDNFEFRYSGYHFNMVKGSLEINGILYEEQDDDPTYMIVRALAVFIPDYLKE